LPLWIRNRFHQLLGPNLYGTAKLLNPYKLKSLDVAKFKKAEMSIDSKERGPEVAVQCVWLISGVALAYWIDFGFTRMSNQVSWRFPIAFQACFASVSIIGMWFLPDTPRWLYARGRENEADEVVMRLHDRPREDSRVQAMRQEILASIRLEDEDEHKFNLLDLLWDKSDLRAGRRIRISFLVLSIQQMMGKCGQSRSRTVDESC
jgi:hypothetical protein